MGKHTIKTQEYPEWCDEQAAQSKATIYRWYDEFKSRRTDT